MQRAYLIALIAGLVLLARTATAQEPAESAGTRAVARGNEGIALYEAGDYAAALARFREADALYHSPVLVLYAARSARNLGDLEQARQTYQRLLDEPIAPNAPDTWRLAQSDARTELAALPVPASASPAPTPEPEPAPVLARAPTPESTTSLNLPALLVAGAGGAALVTATVFGVTALGQKARVERNLPVTCADKTCARSRQAEIEHRMKPAERSALMADILFVSGGALVATGVALFVLTPGNETKVTVGVSPRAAFARFRF